MMKTIAWCFCFSLILPGCSKQQESSHRQDASEKREISAEIFTRNSKNEIVKQSGAVIYFLTASEHEKFVPLLQEWRNKYKSKHEPNSLVREYRRQMPNDPRIDDELTILFGKTNDADGRYNGYPDFLEDYSRLTRPATLNQEPIKQFLLSVHSTTADSEGKFKVLLSFGQECWVVAREEIPPKRRWDFRFIPDGTSLVLSDGNAI
jgi:hypothetical protein